MSLPILGALQGLLSQGFWSPVKKGSVHLGCPHTIVADYTDEAELISGQGGDVVAAATALKEDRVKRQAAWLKRKAGDLTVTKSVIRPRKRHRRAALQWALSLDNQVLHRGNHGIHLAPPPPMWQVLVTRPCLRHLFCDVAHSATELDTCPG